MDKKKVIELIKKAETFLYNSKKEGLDYLYDLLTDIEYEVLKPDWISVDDELPPYKEDVIVCNNIKPKVWMTYRSERDFFKKDDNDFVLHGDCESSISHWRKIDKLEV